MKKIIFLIFIICFIGSKSVFAASFGFADIPSDDNPGLNLSNNFMGEVIDYGGDQVLFTIFNNGPDTATIGAIYFEYFPDYLLTNGLFSMGNSSDGIEFEILKNTNLPQGNNISFMADFGSAAVAPGPKNGVNVDEHVAFLFDGDYEDVATAMDEEKLRIGMHVINIGELSDSYISVPVPEPASVFLMGIGLAGFGIFSRRRLKKYNS